MAIGAARRWSTSCWSGGPLGGLLVGGVIAILMVLAYVGLIRPSVTLSPDDLLIRNHLRDHTVPWNKVTEVDVTDILRVHTATRQAPRSGRRSW